MRSTTPLLARAAWLVGVSAALACSPGASSPTGDPGSAADAASPGTMVLVTLDTTRADRIGWEAGDGAETPTLDRLAERGVRFPQAYTTVPLTLPAHASMLTGLLPADHGIHENARRLSPSVPLVTEALSAAGYRTAAFVSGLPLARRFGLARGFDHYDDELETERRAGDTTDRALAYLDDLPADGKPLFLWVHYFDPHDPYDPPEPFRSRFADDLYQGEIAYVDAQLGRLLDAVDARGETRVVVAGDHGEGLGEHGEPRHGNLLYQGVMRVPLVVAAPGLAPGVRTAPVSTRRIFDTLAGWSSGEVEPGLLGEPSDAVLGEAMKPFLQYGWQPQVMAVAGPIKAIRSGTTEVFDLTADPDESQNLADSIELPRALRQALRDYPSPPPAAGRREAEPNLSRQERERLASLGYVTWSSRSELRPDAPDPKDMTALFAPLDRGSALFVQRRYEEAIPLFERILATDPNNLAVALRLAVAHSALGDDRQALAYFDRARRLDPGSLDARHYLGLHQLEHRRWDDAATLLASVLAEQPERLPAVTGLAEARAAQGRADEAIELLEQADRLSPGEPQTLLRLAELSMARGDTPRALYGFERARDASPDTFVRHLELGVLYMAARRFTEARDALDAVPAEHPDYPMALFKRAQVAVLLDEADRAARIQAAREGADATTAGLIESERLFRPDAGRR